ncbi:efflux RND transporter periplasmic adaptor subunit [Sphingobacterium sp. Mn56C]|uniref:efflux RND transporter periplasmic adaptor subunit n=1 Tax=Sphingobacterium sp. Mn56C TaxID=3395261 RepID=UPI003BD97C0E
MDRQIEKKKWTPKRILTIVAVTGIVALLGASYYFTTGNRKLNIDAERITIAEVKEGIFQEFIPINGTVLPISSIYLDAAVGGRVEQKYVEDGAVLKQGDPIMRLSNTDQELSLVQQETQVLNLLTQAQIARTNAEQVSINNRNQMADVEQALRESERVYRLNKKLFAEKAIGSQEYEKSFNDYNYQKQRIILTKQILKQDSISTGQKAKQDQDTYSRTQRALQLMRKKVGDLILRAPVDGQLTSFDAEIGQNKNAGERLGQIDVLTGFKVRADIDEHYINRIFTDLKGEFTTGGKLYQLKIKKIYTQVTNGRFQVDMEFLGAAPSGIRRGQTLQIRLALSDESKALLLPRGGFYQQSSGNWVFKLNKSGTAAYRMEVQLGRQNPEYFEVVGGLKAGDRVIISSYELYHTIQELTIKN